MIARKRTIFSAALCGCALAAPSKVPSLLADRRLTAALALRGGSAAPSPAPPCLAALWDFDGTLCQSEDVHRKSFSAVLGVELSEQHWTDACIGRAPRDIMEAHLPAGRLKPGETIDDLLRRRAELFEEHIAAGRLEATPGAVALVRELRAAGLRCAVVSSGSRGYIEKALAALGLVDAFDFIIAGDDPDCAQHKPQPWPYLEAARRLGLQPAQCVAFEDSLSGIRSAQGAGLRVVGVRCAANGGCEVAPAEAATLAASPLAAGAPLLPLLALVDDFARLDRVLLGLPAAAPAAAAA